MRAEKGSQMGNQYSALHTQLSVPGSHIRDVKIDSMWGQPTSAVRRAKLHMLSSSLRMAFTHLRLQRSKRAAFPQREPKRADLRHLDTKTLRTSSRAQGLPA